MILSPQELQKKLGLHFHDSALLKSALTHRSAGPDNNERLEFLGDAVLGFVIAECLYYKFPQANEGVLSRLRANLVNQTALAELARQLELGDYLILGSGELKNGGMNRDSILSDALEAVMGAIVEDQGIDVCKRWILGLFVERIRALSLDTWEKDPKTRLQEMMQSKGLGLPVYTLKSKSGLPHQQSFCVECRVSSLDQPAVGVGSSRKRAEQQAAEEMLARL